MHESFNSLLFVEPRFQTFSHMGEVRVCFVENMCVPCEGCANVCPASSYSHHFLTSLMASGPGEVRLSETSPRQNKSDDSA